MNFYFSISGLQIDPEKLGLTSEARFKVEKVIATEFGSSIQRQGPIKYKCDDLYGLDKISWTDIKITIALLIRQFGVADNLVQLTPEKLEELKGEYRPREEAAAAGDEHEISRIPDSQDTEDTVDTENTEEVLARILDSEDTEESEVFGPDDDDEFEQVAELMRPTMTDEEIENVCLCY